MSSTLAAAPLASAARITLRPTPKQAQITGPGSFMPLVDLPDSTARRCSSPSVSLSNSALTVSHCGAASALPKNRQPVSRPSSKTATR